MTDIRTDWTREEIAELFDLPFHELMWRAQTVHRENHAAVVLRLLGHNMPPADEDLDEAAE